jgi:hypothetical protein
MVKKDFASRGNRKWKTGFSAYIFFIKREKFLQIEPKEAFVTSFILHIDFSHLS